MSWMGAIYTDVCELKDLVHKHDNDEDPGELGEVVQHVHGWVTPTVAGLSRSLITEVMSRNEFTDEDKEQMERVISLLGTGT